MIIVEAFQFTNAGSFTLPAITVIIPVLNAMPYLPVALASLEAQTLRDFEVLLWDNGSSDGSIEEARRWIPSRLPGRVVVDRPLPFHECLAAMVQECSTTFIARMDGDDICRPDRLRCQMHLLIDNPNVGAVGGQCPMIDASGIPTDSSHPGPIKHDDIMTEMMFHSALTHPALMFRREEVLRAGNYAYPKPVEDLDLYLRMASFCEFHNLNIPVLDYRLHKKSICQTHAKEQQQLMVKIVESYAEKVYGMSAFSYNRLRQKRSKISMVLLLRSAFFRSQGNPSRLLKILLSPSFVYVGRCLTGRHDYISKASFRVLELLTFMASE